MFRKSVRRASTVLCGLAMATAALSATAFARGGGFGGRSMAGSHGSFHSYSNFRGGSNHMSMNRGSMNRGLMNYGSMNHSSAPTHLMNNSHQSFGMHNFSRGNKGMSHTNGRRTAMRGNPMLHRRGMHNHAHKNGFWKQYAGWGKYRGPRGFGWGVWDSAWCLYDPLPIGDYCNPYCEGEIALVDGIDYSHALVSLPENTVEDSDAFVQAQNAFQAGDLESAMRFERQALAEMPRDRDVHQFHSLLLFAMRDYHRAAAVAHAILEDGPGWNWETLQAFYPSPEIYTDQLRGLERFVTENASQADLRLLLGYHYLMLGHVDTAARQMAQVVELEPRDRLAGRILAAVGGQPSSGPAVARNQPDARDVGPDDGEVVKPVEQKDDDSDTRIKGTPFQVAKIVAARTTAQGEKGPMHENPPAFDVSKVSVNGDSKIVKPSDDELGPVDDSKNAIETPKSGSEEAKKAGKAEIDEDLGPGDDSKPAVNSTPSESVAQQASARVTPATGKANIGQLNGVWNASPSKGVGIELTLRSDHTFSWKFTANTKSKTFGGKYAMGERTLTLTRDDGDVMEGTVEMNGDKAFRFRISDAETDDPGLAFVR